MFDRDSFSSPAEIMKRFSYDDLRGQFVLSRRPSVPEWQQWSIGGWHLATEESLPCVPVLGPRGQVGWLLGRAVSPEGRFVDDELLLPDDDYEQQIYAHGGRFIVILPAWGRVYLDSCGLMAAVYSADGEIVASSPALIPFSDATPVRDELLRELELPWGNSTWPTGMTARHGVEMLLPNHFLDLASWEQVRHWPTGPIYPTDDPEAAIDQIISMMKLQIQATVTDGPAMLRLTAGKDSRMLLACSRNYVSQLECTTADLGDHRSRTDCQVGKKLAQTAGIPHRTLTLADPDEHDLALWLYRTGFGTGELRGWQASTTYRREIDARRSSMVGTVGELARGLEAYWKPDDRATDVVSASRLLSEIWCPETPETIRQMDAWLDDANKVALDAFQLLDLYFVEQGVGCWAGVWSYAETAARYQSFPLAHRHIVEAMMRLPVELRRSGSLPELVIQREWPELLAFPFNQPSPALRVQQAASTMVTMVAKAMRDPGKAVSRLVRRG